MTVTLTVTVTDSTGNETVQTHDFEAGAAETILTGDIGGLVPAGSVARLRGSCRLVDNLHIRGTLLCDPSGVELDGQNLYDIHTHDGTLNLVGVEKTAWCRWGDVPVGWQVGDRLSVAPTAVGVYLPYELTWQGSWATTQRPLNAADVTLVDGSIARPEVVNLSQTVTLKNLTRIMIHEASASNPQTFKWIRVLNSGVSGQLGFYPIHFHQIYDHARGSLLEGVVVEGGKNHAFVPHGSHGITHTDCVAYNTTATAFWWDRPIPGLTPRDISNDTNDLIWDRCLALKVQPFPGDSGNTRLAGFWLGSGLNVACTNSVASCIPGLLSGSQETSGFHWPEAASADPWIFQNCLSHNCGNSGIFTWQNTPHPHHVEDFTSYNCAKSGVNHGAYSNFYAYQRNVLDGATAVIQHAKTTSETPQTEHLVFEDITTNGKLIVPKHNSASMAPTIHRRCTYSQVVYDEPVNGANGSYNIFEDCQLVPADFNMTVSNPGSIAEIYEGGVLVHRWASGVWS